MSNINREALLKHLIAGLLIGGGAGSAVVLGRQLASLGRRAKEQTSTSRDDDTIKLVIRDKDGLEKTASGDSASAAASYLALLAGAASGFLGVKKMSENYRKKKLQEEIDRAQQLYLTLGEDSLALRRGGEPTYGVVKTAGVEHNVFAQVAGVPLALGALIALASGVAANRFLNEQYPKPEKPADKRPKELDLRIVKAEPGPESIELLAKQAMAHPKSTVADLVYAVSHGRGREIRAAVEDQGWDHVFNITKNASHRKTPKWAKNLALVALSNDPILAPGFAKLAAAEYADMAEGFVKTAGYVDSDIADDLVAMAETLNMHTRTKNFEGAFDSLTKQAEFKGGMGLLADRWLPRVIIADAALEMAEKNKAQREAEAEAEATEENPEDVAVLKMTEEDLAILRDLYGDQIQSQAT